MQEIKGKFALITGGGRGIGRATAIALAKKGVHLGLVGRTLENLQETEALLKPFGVKTALATADVSDLDAITKAVKEITETFGSTIDILINNAGISKFGKFLELTPEEWTNIIDVNLKGVYYTTRAVLPDMIDQASGDIINISSTAGQRGGAITSAYSASKAAVLGLSESLMQEVRKHNIRVTALTPSTVSTDMAKNLNLTDGNPEKVMQPEDLAELIVTQLQLNPRVFIKEAGLWSTNP